MTTSRAKYDTDLTDEYWQLIRKHLPPAAPLPAQPPFRLHRLISNETETYTTRNSQCAGLMRGKVLRYRAMIAV